MSQLFLSENSSKILIRASSQEMEFLRHVTEPEILVSGLN